MDENAEVVPGSRRPDGTYRKPVRVKKGYVPPEEQEKFRTVDTTPVGVVGADPAEQNTKPKPTTQAAKKNEKRKEKKKTSEDEATDGAGAQDGDAGGNQPEAPSARSASARTAAAPSAAAPSAAAEVSEVEKKIKNLKKKLRQIDELEEKKESGATLNAEQAAKIAARGDIESEIAKWESLGGEADIGKKIKNLKKKLRQTEELEEKKAAGGELNADQEGKVIAKGDLLDEIKMLEQLSVS